MLKLNEKHFFGNVNQKALIRKGSKILLIQYPEDAIKHPDTRAWGKWDMPGGRLNEGEDVLTGIKREVLEEIGVEVEVVKILATGIFTTLREQKNFFVIYETSLVNEDKPFVLEDEEVGATRWVEAEEILTLPMLYSEYRDALRKVLNI